MLAGRSTWSVRTLLTALLTLAVLPLAAVTTLLGYHTYRAERDLELGRLESAATDVVVGVGDFLQDAEHLLSRWAAEPAVRALRPQACERLFETAGRVLGPEFTNLATFTTDGTPVCSALPSPQGLRMQDAPGFAEAMAAGGLYVTPVQRGRRSGRWSVVLTYPIRDDAGTQTGLITAPVDLVHFAGILRHLAHDPGIIVTVVQPDGVLVSSSVGAEELVGKVVGAFEDADLDQQVVSRHPTVDGRDFTWALHREPAAGWIVVAGRPTEEIYGPLDRVRVRLVILGALLLAVVVGAGVTVSRAVTRPLQKMVKEMSAAGAGEAPFIGVSGPREVAVMAEQFNHAWAAWWTAERRRLQSNERFRSFVEDAVTGIFFADEAGRFRQVNQALAELLGHESEDSLLATSVAGLCSPGPEREAVERRLGAARPFRGAPVTWRRKDGKDVRVRLSARPVTLEGGGAGWEGVVEDVTELTHLQEENLQAQKMEALGRFAGGIAHDFNNILTVLQGHVEMLQEDPLLPEEVRAQIGEMHDAIDRGAALNRQLLTFGRRSARDVAVLDLNDVVRGMDMMIRRLVGEGVEVRMVLDAELGTVRMDRTQLEQVLLNLCVNARDAMSGSGTLLIRTRNLGVSTADPCPEGTWVELSVSDTGSGIPPEALPRIFEPFFTTKPKGQGTGLGLSTVYGIVSQAGGHLRVESEQGIGTTLYACLPKHGEVPKDDAASPERGQRARTGSGIVLLVEDEGGVRRLVKRILERAGYQVMAAPDGIEALRIAETRPERIDILLTDVVMPGMRGQQVAESLAAAGRIDRAVFMSGYPEGLDPERLSFLAAWAHLPKPFTGADLLDLLEHVLAERPRTPPEAGQAP